MKMELEGLRRRLLWSTGVTIFYGIFVGAVRYWKHVVPPRDVFTFGDKMDIAAFAILCPTILFFTARRLSRETATTEGGKKADNWFAAALLGTFMLAVLAALGRK